MAGLGHDEDFVGDTVAMEEDAGSEINSDAIFDPGRSRGSSIPELQEGPGSIADEESAHPSVPTLQTYAEPHQEESFSPSLPGGSGSVSGSERDTSCEGFTRHDYKVIVIGDANSGKTSFIRRYVDGDYSSDVATTIGVDYSLKTITIRQLKMVILLQIWDIAGQDRNRTMVRPFFSDAVHHIAACMHRVAASSYCCKQLLNHPQVGAIIMADCTRMDVDGQFQSGWKDDLDDKVTLPDGRQLPVVLVANKCDLLKEDEIEQLEERCDQIAHKQGYCAAVVASAKDDINVENAVYLLVNQLVTLQESVERTPMQDNTVGLTIGEFTALKQRGYVPQREPQQCGC